jgi:uncharacterized membrane protein
MARKILNGFNIVTSLAFLLAILRFYFGLGGAGLFGTATMNDIMAMIDNPVTNGFVSIVLPFLLLGVTGMIAAIGMMKHQDWGYLLTIIVCVGTVAYDAWAAVAIQTSAIMGMVIPVVLLAYIGLERVKEDKAKKVVT